MRVFYILILLVVSISEFSYGQNVDLTKIQSRYLIGSWHLKYDRQTSKLIFERKTPDHKYGTSLKILKTGDFSKKYSAPCGNDLRLFRGNNKGKWELNEQDGIFTTSIPLYKGRSKFKIINFSSNQIVLEQVKEN